MAHIYPAEFRRDAVALVRSPRRRWVRPGLTRRDPQAAPAPDLVKRHFTVARPDRVWHADYTELPTDQGPLYLVAVIDGCSRLAVGHAMGEHPTAELAIAAVELGVWRRGLRGGDGLIHHSDQGAQGGFNWSSQHPEHRGRGWDDHGVGLRRRQE